MSTKPRASLGLTALTQVPATAYTKQASLVQALESNQLEVDIRELRNSFRQAARRILDQVFEREGIEIIATPADSQFCTYTAVAGEQQVPS